MVQEDHSGVATTDGPIILFKGDRPIGAPVVVTASHRRVGDARTQLSRGRRDHHAGADRIDPVSVASSRSDAEAAARRRAQVGDVRVAARRGVRQAGPPDAVAGREVGGEVGEGHLAQLGPCDATMAVGRAHHVRA